MKQQILNAAEAAEYLNITLPELERLRETPTGPACINLEGNYYYTIFNLDKYATRKIAA